MTTAKELGVTYSQMGHIRQPEKPIRLNSNGVKFIKGFATVFGYDIIDVQEGSSFSGFSTGANGTMVAINVPTKDDKICSVPIDIAKDDYFV